MKKLIVFFLVLSVAFLVVCGCAKKKVDLEAESAKIQTVLNDIIKANEAEDIEIIAKTTAQGEDIVVIGTGVNDRYIGWTPFKEAMEKQFELFDNPKISVRDQIVKVHASGDVAWFSEIVDFTVVVEGKPATLEGVRFSGVMEKQNGNWVIVQSHMSIPVAEEVKSEKPTEEVKTEEVEIEVTE